MKPDYTVLFARQAERVVEGEARRTQQDQEAAETFERARFEAALESAPPKDRQLRDKERRRLDQAKAAEAKAEAESQWVREALVTARVDGRPANERAIDEADTRLARARRDREIAEDVVRRLEDRIVAGVRAEQRQRAERTIADLHARWRAAVGRLVDAAGAVDELAALHLAEVGAAREIAAARGDVAFRWNADHTATERTTGFGAEYVRTPEPSVAIVVDSQAVGRDELVKRLAIAD